MSQKAVKINICNKTENINVKKTFSLKPSVTATRKNKKVLLLGAC